MATVGGLSSGASGSVNMYGANVKGYGGLASGLDTDSLIEGMTIGTRTKIQDALKQKQSHQWEMDGYRSISDKLITFSNKYLNVTSPSSPYRTSFFDKSVVTAHGEYSKYLSVSGASGAIDNMSLLGIKQLAKDSNLVTKNNSSIKELNTSGIDFGKDIDVSKLEGGQLTIQFGEYNYTINMVSGDEIYDATAPGGKGKTDFTTAESTAKSINLILANTKLHGEGVTGSLGDKVNISVGTDTENADSFVLKNTSGEKMTIAGGSASALKIMGFMYEDGDLVLGGRIPTDPAEELVGVEDVVNEDPSNPDSPYPLRTNYSFAKYLGGKTITFNYNGSTKKIQLPDEIGKNGEEGIQDWVNAMGGPPPNKALGMEKMKDYLNAELEEVFGGGKISVELSTGSNGDPSLSFKTPDSSSTLRITDADTGIMDVKGIFGISYSTTNRLNTEGPIAKSGLNPIGSLSLPAGFGEYTLEKDPVSGVVKKVYTPTDFNDAEGNLYININGKSIPAATDKAGNPIPRLKADSSLKEIITAINDSDAGVRMKYNETADRFSMEATVQGEAGKVDVTKPGTSPNQSNFIQLLTGTSSDHTIIQGQDAIMTVKYDGNIETDIKRDSNSFKLDGSTFTLNNTFGFEGSRKMIDGDGNPAPQIYDSSGQPLTETIRVGATPGTTVPEMYDSNGILIAAPSTAVPGSVLYDYDFPPVPDSEPVTFTSAVDTEKVTKVIGTMVEDYNVMADLVNKLVGTKPDRNYGPLTDDEKAQLNSDQIKQLEDKAKDGILFNDTLLRSLSDKMRSVFSGAADVGTLKSMGLNISNSWKDNGKVSFNEEDFKNALLEDSEKIKKLFTEQPTTNSEGKVERVGGISVRLKAIADDFAGINTFRKGSLIEKAGSTAAPTSVLQNSLKKMMDRIDLDVDKLKDKLRTEVDRYSRQFSSLEQLISQMNSQSSWLSQATGG